MVAVGVTGHQQRAGVDWDWVKSRIAQTLEKISGVSLAYSCLAVGADQTFAELVIAKGTPHVAVIPLSNYEGSFSGDGLKEFRRLISCSRVVELHGKDPQSAFFEAGCFVVDHSDIVIAVWDGLPSKGFGGTADIVAYAQSNGRQIVHINPVTKAVR